MVDNDDRRIMYGPMVEIEKKRYITVEEEEAHMQEVYDSLIGDIEEYMFLTPNWINKERKKERTDLRMLPTLY